MCYAKPGPRCADYAKKALVDAQVNLKEGKRAYKDKNIKTFQDSEHVKLLAENVYAARRDYWGTDEGRKKAEALFRSWMTKGEGEKAAAIDREIYEAMQHREKLMVAMRNAQQVKQEASVERAVEVGFPRPKAQYRRVDPDTGEVKMQQLPIPWIATQPDNSLVADGWKSFEGAKPALAHVNRLCQVCGKEVRGKMVHLDVEATPAGHPHVAKTSGPGVHARCALVTKKFCPHFNKQKFDADTPLAFSWNEAGQGYITRDTDEKIRQRVAVGNSPAALELSLEQDYLPALHDAEMLTLNDIKKLARAEINANL